jgi:di/tricarboxylate transporter
VGIDAIIVLVALVAILIALAVTNIAPDAILVAGLTLMLIVPFPAEGAWRIGVIGPAAALAGFSNPGLATVAVLFIVVEGLRETGAIDWMAQGVLGRPRGVRRALARFVVPVCGVSAFVNNTPLVAMLIPVISDWSKKLGLAPSKLMIPLSYATILGGTCSLIGTSTNLVVAGLVVAHTDLPPLRMFDITPVGVPCAILGCAFLVLLGPSLLPNRGSASSVLADPREYTMEMTVPEGSSLAGRTVEQAGLRSLPGCYLVEIDRQGELIAAVGPDQVLHVADRLLFTGVVESIRDLQNLRGLAPATNQVFKLDSPRYRRRLFEAVVSPSCPLVGKTIREGRFRTQYEGAVIAVARNGERVRGKIGDIELQPGDTLLIEASPRFAERLRNSRDFLLVSALDDSAPRRHGRAPVALVILIGMVVLAASGVTTMLVAALAAGALMVITRCATVSEARRSVDWSVLIVIGAALGIGEALTATDAAGMLAREVLAVAGSNPWLALAGVYVLTALVTAIITNNAAVALMFPIAQVTAQNLNVEFMPFVITIMMAGSASFATPLGYQTNLMVYGPGGYRFGDFVRIGLPMNALVGLATIILTPLVFKF